jgi:hypothetical protein
MQHFSPLPGYDHVRRSEREFLIDDTQQSGSLTHWSESANTSVVLSLTWANRYANEVPSFKVETPMSFFKAGRVSIEGNYRPSP